MFRKSFQFKSIRGTHNYQGNWLQQEYPPTDSKGMKFWKPKDSGWEKNKYEDIRKKRKS